MVMILHNRLAKWRDIDVFVYRNLRYGCWSLRIKGKVMQHAHLVSMRDVTFKVSQAGRRRVVRDRKKNVHAGLQGKLIWYENYLHLDKKHSELLNFWTSDDWHDSWKRISYDPYKHYDFIDSKDGSIATPKRHILMIEGWGSEKDGVWYKDYSEKKGSYDS